jgi:hypothetical protein
LQHQFSFTGLNVHQAILSGWSLYIADPGIRTGGALIPGRAACTHGTERATDCTEQQS